MFDVSPTGRPAGQPADASVSSPPGQGGGQRGQYGGPDTGEVHLLDRLAVLYRYRRIMISVFVLSTAALMIQGYSSVRVYSAQGRLLIEDERSTTVPGLPGSETGFFEDPEPYYQTQYRILRGRDLTRRVARKLDLMKYDEFNGRATPPPTGVMLIRDVEARIRGLLRMRPVTSAVPSATTAETPRPDESPDESALVGAFISRVGVEPVAGSRLVDVTFTSLDPAFAALAVNTLMEEYVQQNLEVKTQSTQNMLEWLQKELSTQQTKVEESERALAEYRDKQNALSLDDKQNIVLARLNQLNDQVMRARTTRLQRESQYNQARAAAPGTAVESIPVISQSQPVVNAKQRIADLQRQKATLSERYGEKHPQIQSLNSQIEEAGRQLTIEAQRAQQNLKNEYESAVLEEQTMAKTLEAAKADAVDLNRKGIGYGVMEREARSNRQVYEALLQRDKELRVASNSRTNNVRLIDRAEVPKAPLLPSGRRTWLTSALIGLVLAMGVAFGLDYMNDTIKTPEDVTRRLKLPFLGLVPSVRGDKHPVLAASHVPHDFGEAFRALRTSLMGRYPQETTKILVVTSAQPLEGKTTTACNIGMALAYGGARVLLIDGDMRRPGMHRALRLSNDRGLSQILSGQARVRDVIQRTVDPNLLAITAGRIPPNPSELLASERMKTLLANLGNGPFDWIIVDTPPVLAVTDAVVLAPWVSGVTFVIGAEMTRRRLAERAIDTVLTAHPKMTAVVLNKVDFARNKYYYSRYYGHQYKNYYAAV